MNNQSTDPKWLRAEAEAQLAHSPAIEAVLLSNQKLLHELQVHQIQLEMQNVELRRMQLILEDSRDQYADLYNHAPVGYLTLTHDGLIDRINLTALELFGAENCNALRFRRFTTFITAKDGDSWYLFFVKVMKHNQRASIELTMKGSNDTEIPVQLDCMCINSMLRITMTDLSKIKQAEADLHQAETVALMDAEHLKIAEVQQEALNRLQKIASQLPGMVFQYCIHDDGRDHFLYVSDAIHELFGLSPEEVCEDATRLFSVIHPDDYDELIANIQKVTLALSPFNYEYRVISADGKVKWLLGKALPERQDNEGSTLWHGFVTDISERRFAEQQWQFQTSLLMAVGQAVIATDQLGKITYLNHAAETMYGWRFDEALGLSILEVTQPQMSRALAEEIMTDLAFGGTWKNEMFMKHRDGTIFPVEFIETPFFDEKRKMIGIIDVSSDITKRKLVDDALKDSNRLLDFSLHHGHMGSWELNVGDNSFKRTLEHDRIFGYESLLTKWSYEDFLGHVVSEDRYKVNHQFQKSIVSQEELNFECRIRRADGELRWIWFAGGYNDYHTDTSSGMYGIVKDITKRKNMDQLLLNKNADLEHAKIMAEEANNAKSAFLSRMSHELRTPLNAILGYAQLLEAGTPQLADKQLERLKPIIKSGWYLLELINEILDLNAIESGNLALSPELLSIKDVLLECQIMVQAQAENENILLDFIPCDSSWTIYVDKTRIKQILLNLLSNAIKYNKVQGKVTVQCIQTSEHIQLFIKDTGEGLSVEQLAQLFKPFNRLGQERGNKQGTGIGLVVTKELVEQMGGSISVESTVGVGSEFCVILLRDERRIKPRS